jgi:hypothetical protein
MQTISNSFLGKVEGRRMTNVRKEMEREIPIGTIKIAS